MTTNVAPSDIVERPAFFSLRKRLFSGRGFYFIYLFIVVAFSSGWHAKVVHHLSIATVSCFASIGVASLAYGHLFVRFTTLSIKGHCPVSLEFICGHLLSSLFLFVLLLATPFGIIINFSIVLAVGLLCLGLSSGRKGTVPCSSTDRLPDLLCLVLSAIAATLWCADSLSYFSVDGQTVVYRMWSDSFFHAREISIFSQAHGIKSIVDLRMAGVPASIYHYVAYAFPASIANISGVGAYDIFASFMMPVGLLISGLAAFSLAASIWGIWPGVAATVAVLLIPDACQQGFQNKYLGYHFLQNAVPGGLYGAAYVALSWIFILDGCKTKKLASIGIGYGILFLSLAYKAHFFVANAFLVMIYPCIFFSGIKIKWRAVIGVLLISLFVCLVAKTRPMESIPTLRLDGSSRQWYSAQILRNFAPGTIKDFFESRLSETHRPNLMFGATMAMMIAMSTFGLWIVACFSVFYFFRNKIRPEAAYFPLFVCANYLVMSTGLAVDAKSVGWPDELLHRPFAWAYFAVIAWTGSGLYMLLIGNRPPSSNTARISCALLTALCLAFPVAFARNLTTMSHWEGCHNYKEMNGMPRSLVTAVKYIHDHSSEGEILQDSEGDSHFRVTALTERQEFAIDSSFGNRKPKELQRRLEYLCKFKEMSNEAEIAGFAKAKNISWYLLQPETKVSWPQSLLQSAVFESGGYRVYHFTPSQ